ncbi:MAG: serine/threonine-protein phosphatase [Clostridium sp.]|nr:serine/threonine-protein phosphatase [Clostridium sp.]
MGIVVGAVSDKGNVKKLNQDNFLIKIYQNQKKNCALFVMCDGIGGLSNGEVASSIAVKYFKEWFKNNFQVVTEDLSEKKVINLMSNALNEVNNRIIKYGQDMSIKLGTTVSALLFLNIKYFIVHVGDSRIYKLNSKINQLTEDHTYVAMSVKNKTMTKEEARNNPKKHILTQCIGVKKNIDIYKAMGKIYKNDFFILCCDGLYNKIQEKELLNNIKSLKEINNETLQGCAQKCVNVVKNRGEVDNISMIIVGFMGRNNFLSKLKKRLVLGI